MEIKALDKGSVHRLCSGQVVLTFATAVKELLENSLDAGAKNITIRLKSSGLELIEVADDGCGVEENNFQALTLKHFTSKLSAFTDLTCVQTFGFRGEALSSLCALSDVSMSTCTRTSKGARRVSYDHTGKVTSVSICHREPGTTVMVENLFSTLPVRRKELEKNVTKEFNKMVTNISGYCLLCEGVKLTMTNQAKNKGSSTTVLKINSNLSAKENIIDVFGVKQWSSLRELKMVPPDDDVLRDFHLKPPLTHHFVISGFLSSAEHGKGRSSNDRQFLFVNKRPFDNPKLLRLVNEVYHSFNSHQSPFVLLNINTPTTNVDVNVTPDKRQVFMHDEKVLLAVVKASLRALYINTPSLFTSVSSSLKLKRTLNSDGGGDDNDLNKSFSWSSSSSLLQSFKRQKTLDDSLVAAPTSSQDDANNSINNNNTNNNNNNNKIDNNKTINFDNNMNSNDNNLKNNNNFDDVDECLIQESSLVNFKVFIDSEPPYSPLPPHTTPQYSPQFSTPPPHHTTPPNSSTPLQRFQNHKQSKHNLIQQGKQQHTPKQQPQLHHHHTPKQQQQHGHSKRGKYDVDDDDEELLERRRSVEVEFSMEKLRRNFMKKNNRDEAPRRERRFKAELTDNQRAEEELKRSIDKASFQRMQVLGQFNLGFIITLLDRNHLFIIDQHATDEKYNFEWLEKNVVLKNQKLIRPQRLELTVCNESILLENLDVFSSNGFEFMVDHAAPATQRVSLVSIPTSRDWLFGQQDIQEMIFMLSDAPKTLCRPSRIRQMLASRACRKSVMIGTALQHRQMLKIVRHMALMQQPWNCPHGRPTIRHLIDLNMVNQP